MKLLAHESRMCRAYGPVEKRGGVVATMAGVVEEGTEHVSIDPADLEVCLRVLAEADALPADDPGAMAIRRATAGLYKAVRKRRKAERREAVLAADRAVDAATATAAPGRIDDETQGLPLAPRPFQVIAERLGITESEIIARLTRLTDSGAISRVGPVFRPKRVGVSTLAAMAVPRERLDAVAAMVSSYAEVNHNYEREHRFNLWFVLTAADQGRLSAVIAEISERSGLSVLDLPMLAEYHINLGFSLQWS